MNRCRLTFAVVVFFTGSTACKKNHLPESELSVSPTTGTRTQFTLDSIYLYTKQIYLWNDALPDYVTFNPRAYTSGTSDLQNFKQVLYALSQYKINTATSLPFEKGLLPGLPKYSYINSSAGASGLAAMVDTEGNGNDFGLSFIFSGERGYVRMVDEGSPATLAGIRRGDAVLQVNGSLINEGMLQAGLDGVSLSLKLQRGEAGPKTVTLQKAAYTSNPVMKAIVLNTENTAIGYLAFSRFTHLKNSKSKLDDAFSSFAASEISTLVLDLRYNSGGYVETARYLANLMVPSVLNGKVIYSEHFNSQMQQDKGTILKNQPYLDEYNKPVYLNGRRATYADIDFSVRGNTYFFQKQGSLQSLKNIYFIVSGETASASEMLINCLKPYFNVKLIGGQTYGKPVGFFGVTIDRYKLYAASFLIQNVRGEGDYFNGLLPDLSSDDDVTHDFGDEQEECLRTALRDLAPRSFGRAAGRSNMDVQSQSNLNLIKNTRQKEDFPGMIKEELRLIKKE